MTKRPFFMALAAGGALLLGSAGAQASSSFIFDRQVNMPAPPPPPGTVDNFPQNKQNEPSITRDPRNGALIAGSNDEIDEPLCTGMGTTASPGSCPFAPNVGVSGDYFSLDNGMTWQQPAFTEAAKGTGTCEGRVIHTLPGYCNQGLESFGDPILAVGPAPGSNGAFSFSNGSTVYYGNLAFPAGAAVPVLAVSRSNDDGAHWRDPVVASTTDNPVDFNDKDFVWADANPNSSFFGNVYASWTLFVGAGRFGRSNTFEPEPIVFARSTDGGQTWSRPIHLSDAANNGAVGGRQGSSIQTGPDGTVYVFWEGAVFHHSEQLVAVSHDGGMTFGRPLPVAAVSDLPSPLPGSSWRTDSFPSSSVNQANGDLYVVWADFDVATSTALIKFTQSQDGGATWSTPSVIGGRKGAFNAFFPGVATGPDGKHIFVGWPVQKWAAPGTKPGPGVVFQFAAFTVRTNDPTTNLHSGTFGTASLLSSGTGDPDGSSTNGLGAQFLGDYATAVASNDNGWFVWTDTRNEVACSAVDAFRAGLGPKPNPDLQCPGVGDKLFGNSDIFVGAVAF
jgi:hypothetical protein